VAEALTPREAIVVQSQNTEGSNATRIENYLPLLEDLEEPDRIMTVGSARYQVSKNGLKRRYPNGRPPKVLKA